MRASLIIALFLLLGAARLTFAQPGGMGNSIPVGEGLQALITDLARQAIPHDYENAKQWNKTKTVIGGLFIKREGLRIKTHRQKKQVNHGTWTRYRIELIDPDQRLHIRLNNLHRRSDNRPAFDLVCDARLRVVGRLARWQRGVQLISLSAEAEADVRLTIRCDAVAYLDLSIVPPDIVLDPVVRDANLEIRRFRVRRISRLDGPLVKQLSSTVREVLEDEIERRREKLVTRINRQLEKHSDKFRLSLRKTLESQWGDLSALLPAKEDTAE